MELKYLPDTSWEVEGSQEYKTILEIIGKEEKEILPKEEENSGIFYALNITPLEKVSVLIIGQDPYPNKDRAHGLAFSFKNNTPAKDSLKNIFTKLSETDNYRYENTNLTCWAQQGVLLLNTSLTYTSKNDTNKWRKLWEPFISFIIKKLIDKKIETKSPLVIILWGSNANDIPLFTCEAEEEYKKNNILILRSSHPSNIGDAKNKPLKGIIHSFMDSNHNHFKECNEYLKSKGREEINWHT